MDILDIDKAIRDINPKPFEIYSQLFDAILRDKDMGDIWLWMHWSLYAIKGMTEINLEEIRKLQGELA